MQYPITISDSNVREYVREAVQQLITPDEVQAPARQAVNAALAQVPPSASYGHDCITPFRALDMLGQGWSSVKPDAQRMLYVKDYLGHLVRGISGTDELVSTDTNALNEVLTRHGIPKAFLTPLGVGEVGFVALVHNLYKWLTAENNRTTKLEIDDVEYPAYVMAPGGFRVYKVNIGGTSYRLLELLTQPDYTGEPHGRKSVWLLLDAPHGLSPMQVMAMSIEAMLQRHVDVTEDYSTATIPMVDAQLRQELEWMEGLENIEGDRITWAVQDIVFRMDEKAAEIIVATSGAAVLGVEMTVPVIVDREFIAWGTEMVDDGKSGWTYSLPLGSLFVDRRDWKRPENIGANYQENSGPRQIAETKQLPAAQPAWGSTDW